MEINSKLLFILVISSGALFFVIGNTLLYNTYVLVKNGNKVEGKIIGFSEKYNSSKWKKYRKKIYAPIIQFQNLNGETKEFKSGTFSSKEKYSLNESIHIITYDKYPFAKIDSFKALWLIPLFVTLFGVVIIIIGFYKFT